MKKTIILLFSVVLLLFAGAIVDAYTGGPPDGRTGAPGETDCTANCHNSFPVNSGDGSLAIQGVPAAYNPAETYTITVRLEDPGQEKWGFEVTALDDSDSMAGTFVVTDSTNTQLSSSSGRDYVKHTGNGAYDGTSNGPVSWSFDWVAPAAGTGTIAFYAAGNAANSGSGNKQDYIYTTSASTDEGNGGGSTNQLPICSISSPTSGVELAGTVTISGTASDADGTLVRVELRIDSGSWIEVTGTDSWSHELDTTGLENGQHTISARAYDGTGYSNVVDINVEINNPSGDGGDTGEDSSDGGMFVLIVSIIVIILVVLAVIAVRRGR